MIATIEAPGLNNTYKYNITASLLITNSVEHFKCKTFLNSASNIKLFIQNSSNFSKDPLKQITEWLFSGQTKSWMKVVEIGLLSRID